MNIDKWNIFSMLKPEFKRNLKSVFVFGMSGTETLMITKDDDVYGLGLNLHSCLGVHPPSTSYFVEPVKVEEFSGIVNQFSAGSGPHVVALTSEGTLMTFGSNNFFELGSDCKQPSKVANTISFSSDSVFIQVACGSYHNLALTDKGDVYAWGKNNHGQSDFKYTGNIQNVKCVIGEKSLYLQDAIKMVACGYDTSFALSKSGKVYSWGNDEYGKLGVDSNSAQPYVVPGITYKVTKIACGHSHTLALCDNGQLFAWGINSLGQLGIGSKFNGGSKLPVETCKDIGRVIDIAAVHYSHTSAAKTIDGDIYMWGECGGHTIVSPTITPFKELFDVFACYSKPSVTPQMLRVFPNDGTLVLDSLKHSFDCKEHSDLKIIVENKPIYVHKTLLKIRSEHLRRMLGSSWEESTSSEIILDKFCYKTYRSFLYYLYTGEVEIEENFAAELLELSHMYLEEELKIKCASIIQSIVTIENVAHFYSYAILHQSKELENTCFNFFLAHSKAVVLTDAFDNLDPLTMKGLIIKAAECGAFKY